MITRQTKLIVKNIIFHYKNYFEKSIGYCLNFSKN